MKYDLYDTIQKEKAKNNFNAFLQKESLIELKEIKYSRTNRQNSALHLYFKFIAEELNELGLEFQYQGLKGSTFSLRYTPDLVKNFIWKPIQKALFDIDSTKDLTTNQINEVIDVITKFFGDRGIVVEFPSIENV